MVTNLQVKAWLDDIDHAKKREKDFRKDGEEINKIYDGCKQEQVPFNILYSNTETLIPALYSQTPRPIVKRRQNDDESALTKAVEQAGTRILEYFLDTNIEGYEKFDDSMKDAVQDGALPGRGVTQIKFDAEMDGEDLKWAFICTDSKKWDRVIIGKAKKWAQVPWIAFEEYLDKEECTELFKDKVSEIKFSEDEGDDETDRLGDKDSRKTAQVYQIWDKSDKKVKWISPQYDGYLREDDDPLGISGFFNVPKPLMFHRKSNNMTPTAVYKLYEDQAKELNEITLRLRHVVKAIKVRGLYDGALSEDLGDLLEGGDASLKPTDKGASLVDGGLKNAIWFMPIGELIATAQQLMEAREQCKRVIYEITGLSDVIRGQSKASETLGAQKIKESWGSMRLKNYQKDVQNYVRDTLRIMLDVASTQVPLRFWGKYTGLDFPTDEEKAKVTQELQQLQMAQQQTQPNQPPPNPKLQEKAKELTLIAQKPTWEQILEVLQDDLVRSYKIDIETNSTLDAEATEDQKNVGEFMNAMGQFMNGMMPMIEGKILPFGAAKAMLLEIARRYRFGVDVENEIKSMQEPPQQNPEQQQEQMKQQGQQLQKAQQQIQQQTQQFEQQKKQAGDQLDQQARDLEKQKQEFAFEQKLADQQRKFDEQLKEQRLEMKSQDDQADIKLMFEKQKREIQGMIDRSKAKA